VTEEDRRLLQEAKLAKTLRDYEKLRSTLQGKYPLLTQTARRAAADERERRGPDQAHARKRGG